jgi:fructokinase
MSKRPTVLCYGEVLWNLQPEGKQISGLPVIFGYHLKQMGADVNIISAVGNDLFGKEVLNKITSLNLKRNYIQVKEHLRTSTKSFTLDAKGNPLYIIDEPVAWDCIEMNEALKSLASKADIISFNLMAQRNSTARQTIYRLLCSAKSNSLRILSFNLHQQPLNVDALIQSLKFANILKINKAELKLLSGALSLKGNEENILSELLHTFNLQFVVLMKGNESSSIVTPFEKSVLKMPKIDIVEDVGAEDAFMATLVFDYFNKLQIKDIHHHAVNVWAYVCTHYHATPVLPNFLLQN